MMFLIFEIRYKLATKSSFSFSCHFITIRWILSLSSHIPYLAPLRQTDAHRRPGASWWCNQTNLYNCYINLLCERHMVILHENTCMICIRINSVKYIDEVVRSKLDLKCTLLGDIFLIIRFLNSGWECCKHHHF